VYGTTHPFLTLQFLTEGRYDPTTALFTAPNGREKHLVATDHLESELFRALTTDDLFDIVVRSRLHFDQARQTGVVFHMLSGLSELGSVGLTAVGDSPVDAEALFRRAERILLEEAGPAPEPALPGGVSGAGALESDRAPGSGGAGVGRRAGYRPSGWRALKPREERTFGRQRGPWRPLGSPAALVSRRSPAITTYAWPRFV
jgi:hypothetical protein